MARYKICNRFFFEEKYAEHVDGRWVACLFLIGAVAGGIIAYKLMSSLSIIKAAKIFIIIVSSIGSGILFAKMRPIIRVVVYVLIALSILVILGVLIRELL